MQTQHDGVRMREKWQKSDQKSQQLVKEKEELVRKHHLEMHTEQQKSAHKVHELEQRLAQRHKEIVKPSNKLLNQWTKAMTTIGVFTV